MNKHVEKWKKKSLFSKITDILIIVLVIALLTPGGRLAIGGFVNRIKAMIINPDTSGKNIAVLSENDYNWQLVDLQNNKVNFYDFKGKVVFVNFWATWCPPCVGEMPEIQELYDNFKNNDNVKLLLVTNEPIEKVKAFIADRGYTFPVYLNKMRKPSVFQTSSIPTSFLISKKGEIKIKETGAANWGGDKMKSFVEKLINE